MRYYNNCSKCGKYKRVRNYKKKGRLICANCIRREKVEFCSICNIKKPVNKRINGKPICSACTKGKIIGKCVKCKNIKKLEYRNKTICSACYKKENKKRCDVCGKIHCVNSIIKGLNYCSGCAKKINKELCSICKKLKIVSYRKNEKPICENCRISEKKEICYKCKKEKRVYSRNENNHPVCPKCGIKNKKCSQCGRTAPAVENINNNILCYRCYCKKKYLNEIDYNIKTKIRTSFYSALKNYSKTGKIWSIKKYGINIESIIRKLGESPGKNYHIDHIFPCKAFNLSNLFEIWACWHPDNLQWLEASKNIEKGYKYNKKKFEKYINSKKQEYKVLKK